MSTVTNVSTVLEVRPQNGGKDAEEFAGSLANSVTSALRRKGFVYNITAISQTSRAFIVHTDAPVSKLRWLEGVHVVTRIPKGASARHTSSVSVVVRDDTQHKSEVAVRSQDIRVDRYRGTGPGGQHRNKTSSSIRLVHAPSGIVITRESGRSQNENLQSAMAELHQRLAVQQSSSYHQQVNAAREILSDKTRTFTHDHQRSEVTAHRTGKRYGLKMWQTGRFDICGQ